MCLVSAPIPLFFEKAYETSWQILHIAFLTPLIVSFLKTFQTTDFSSVVEATSAALIGGLKGGSEETIKFVDGVSGCVNESIGVSGKGICKSYHSWLVKFKLRFTYKKDC